MKNEAFVYGNKTKLFDYNIMSFGEWLREQIKNKGLSNAEVARRAKVSATYVGNLVRNFSPNTKSQTVKPSEEVVENIAFAVGASIDSARLAAGYSPSKGSIPDAILKTDFSIFSEDQINEIIAFIKFKRSEILDNYVKIDTPIGQPNIRTENPILTPQEEAILVPVTGRVNESQSKKKKTG